ncbi:MAG: CBS domain-containing protein [Nannocystaceae bacterium]|nr:CBS domain-containing protein [bacterium]
MNAKSWTISDFMTPVVCCADVELTLADARDRMTANKIRHLLITRGPMVVGVLSQRDIDVADASAGKREALTIADAMHTDVFTCNDGAPLGDVVAAMESRKIGCTIVRDGSRAVGIFTTTDALRAVRALLAGEQVEPLSPPTHIVPHDEIGPIARHDVRVSESVRSASGMIGSVGL